MPIKNTPTDAPLTRRDAWFDSGSDRCHAWLYLPAHAAGPPPVVVMAHGLGGVKTLRLDAFAERFVAAGYACLVFDYRNFGESTGEPRELLSIRHQREDWRAAIAFARTLREVDGGRVVLWGSSFGGGHVIATAAAEPEVVAAIAQCPFTDGLASAMQIGPAATARLAAAAVRDQVARALGRSPVRVKVAARPGEVGLMSSQDVVDGVLGLLKASGIREEDYRNDVPARVAFEIPLNFPGRQAADVRCPILFCVCEQDTVAPAAATLRHAAAAPRGEVRRYAAGHFDIYAGPEFEQVVADQLDFLARHAPANGVGAST